MHWDVGCLGRKVRDKDKVGRQSWGPTIKYLNAVHRLSCNEGSTILGFSGKTSLDKCLGKRLVAMGRSEWRREIEADTSQKE